MLKSVVKYFNNTNDPTLIFYFSFYFKFVNCTFKHFGTY